MQFSIVSLKCRLTCRAKLTTALHVQELMKNNKNHINFKGSKLKLNFLPWSIEISLWHYCNAIMGTVASQITSLTIVYSTVYSDADHRKHQSSASLAFVWGIHRGPVNSPHKWPVTRKMLPFDDVIMDLSPAQSQNTEKYTQHLAYNIFSAFTELPLPEALFGILDIEYWICRVQKYSSAICSNILSVCVTQCI